MENKNNFSFNGRIRSIKYALEGISLLLKTQYNAWVHLATTVIVILTGIILNIEALHWVIIIVAIVSVWVAEALNTAFELLCDVTHPTFHPVVKKAKDVSAGAVLISALGSIIIGLIVFVPYILQ
jgi:diacylglycerol kinase (ATP)